jgi:hypothetical protein
LAASAGSNAGNLTTDGNIGIRTLTKLEISLNVENDIVDGEEVLLGQASDPTLGGFCWHEGSASIPWLLRGRILLTHMTCEPHQDTRGQKQRAGSCGERFRLGFPGARRGSEYFFRPELTRFKPFFVGAPGAPVSSGSALVGWKRCKALRVAMFLLAFRHGFLQICILKDSMHRFLPPFKRAPVSR